VDWHFPVTVLDVVLMGRFGHQKWLQRARRADRRSLRKAWSRWAMADMADRSISDLSAGNSNAFSWRVHWLRNLTFS